MPLKLNKTRSFTLCAITLAFIFLIVGVLIGYRITPSQYYKDHIRGKWESKSVKLMLKDSDQKYLRVLDDQWEQEESLLPDILTRIDPENIKNYLRYLSEKPHLASTPRDEELAQYIQRKYQEAGFDSSELIPYNVYLTKPNSNNPNKIRLHKNGALIFESNHKEKPVHPDDEDPNFVHAFLAFTPAGTVSTSPGVGVVYVNYGRIEDFKKLEELQINVTGHIVLCRYGKIYRGNKIAHAEQYGAKGIIMFSDPEDVAPEGVEPKDVYGNSWWLPGTGIERGTANIVDGDLLTPGWPSTDHAYRLSENETDMHKIPSQPIGYADAREILERLGGEPAPKEWQGRLPELTYRLGPSFNQRNRDVSLTLSTHNYGEITKAYNVIGVIRGSVEPDRYVMLGNHRDAWGYGAADPSSGTAQLLETVRVFGTLLKEGWRPRRSLVFCSWAAEEYGLIGSTEWVEENINKLQDRTVAYVNTDLCTSGPSLQLDATPLLHGVFLEMTKLIPGVRDSSKTLFEEWEEHSKRTKPGEERSPTLNGLGSGSDYAPFTVYAGIPAADIWFRRDESEHNISTYPFYHTGYETFYMVSTFVDPDFRIHQGCGRLALLSLKFLADSAIIPYSIQMLPKIMLENLKKSKNRDTWIKIYDKYNELENSIRKFDETVQNFFKSIESQKLISELQVRAINDQMMKLEQVFLIPEGLPGRPTLRNALQAPNQFDIYASSGFPGLSDLLFEYDALNVSEKAQREKQIRRHISDLTIMTDRASSLLKDAYLI